MDPNRIDWNCCEAELDIRAKNRPRPVAKASTVPVAISRCEACLPKAAITKAPPSANAPMPNETGSPRGAGQADVCQGMRRERRIACDGEIPHHAGGECDAQPGDERVEHEGGCDGRDPLRVVGE